jgi:hypothetical protein
MKRPGSNNEVSIPNRFNRSADTSTSFTSSSGCRNNIPVLR